jgi:hypothetical protein
MAVEIVFPIFNENATDDPRRHEKLEVVRFGHSNAGRENTKKG